MSALSDMFGLNTIATATEICLFLGLPVGSLCGGMITISEHDFPRSFQIFYQVLEIRLSNLVGCEMLRKALMVVPPVKGKVDEGARAGLAALSKKFVLRRFAKP